MDVEEVVEQTKEEIIAIHNAPILADIDNLARKIEDMNSLCTSIINYTQEVDLADCKGASIDSLVTIYNQYLKIQTELTDFYLNTATALQLTRDSFNGVDNLLGNFFKELTVD